MPNELFGSVGFALSADRRRPKTLGPEINEGSADRQVNHERLVNLHSFAPT